MARKSKPTKLKLVEGNRGKRALNVDEPEPPIKFPSPPDHLCTCGKAEWRRLAKGLRVLGMITIADRGVMGIYCEAYGRWVEACKAISKHGMMLRSPKGQPSVNPFVHVANRCVDMMIKSASELGLTPASRSRIKVEVQKPNPVTADLSPLSVEELRDLRGMALRVLPGGSGEE